MESYQELLIDNRWKSYRLKVNNENSWICAHCQNNSYIQNYLLGHIKNLEISTQVLHAYSAEMMMNTTYKIEFQSETVTKTGYFTSFNPIKKEELIDSDIYYSYNNNYLSIQAIRKLEKWFYVKDLHVHHKYYQDTKQPWEYPLNALQSLCWQCHMNLHSHTKIEWLDSLGRHIGELTYCDRCGGAGTIPEFTNIENGICFKCRGAKYIEHIK